MEKILLAIDATSANMNTLDFACYIARLTHSKLTGIFLENMQSEDYSFTEVLYAAPFINEASASEVLEAKDKSALCEQNIALFREACLNRGINCVVHRDRDVPEKEIILESRFADLMIVDSKISFASNAEGAPSAFVKRVLAKSECPVIIAPETFFTVDELIFAYDGSVSAVYAIKQFTYLLPQLDDVPVTVLQVNENNEWTIEERRLIGELLQPHYSNVNFKTLKGKASEELFRYMIEKKNAFVVMGSFGRSNFSNFFKPSSAQLVIKAVNLPVFIAHANHG